MPHIKAFKKGNTGYRIEKIFMDMWYFDIECEKRSLFQALSQPGRSAKNGERKNRWEAQSATRKSFQSAHFSPIFSLAVFRAAPQMEEARKNVIFATEIWTVYLG